MSQERLTKDEILSLSLETIERATEKELRAYTRTLNDVANKRLKRLEETGYMQASPAYVTVEKGGKRGQGKFSLKDKKTRNEVLAEFTRVRGFITAKTSTVKGTKQLQKRLDDRLGKHIKLEQQAKMWEIYNELKNRQLAVFNILSSDRVQQHIAERMENYDNIDTAIDNLERDMIKMYEEEESLEEFLEVGLEDKLPF